MLSSAQNSLKFHSNSLKSLKFKMSLSTTNQTEADVEVYFEMSEAVSVYFTNKLGKVATQHDILLTGLSIDDFKADAKYETKFLVMSNDRNIWVEIFEGLSTDEERIDFALLTLYRNSQLSTIHISSLKQIVDDVITPYMKLLTMCNDDSASRKLLNHILIIPKLMQHYHLMFSYGVINFVNRSTSYGIIANDSSKVVCRISFAALGNIVLSHGDSIECASLILGQQDPFKKNGTTIKYNIETLVHKSIEMRLYDEADMYNSLLTIKGKQLYNVYGNKVNNQIVWTAMANHQAIKQQTDSYYSSCPLK